MGWVILAAVAAVVGLYLWRRNSKTAAAAINTLAGQAEAAAKKKL